MSRLGWDYTPKFFVPIVLGSTLVCCTGCEQWGLWRAAVHPVRFNEVVEEGKSASVDYAWITRESICELDDTILWEGAETPLGLEQGLQFQGEDVRIGILRGCYSSRLRSILVDPKWNHSEQNKIGHRQIISRDDNGKEISIDADKHTCTIEAKRTMSQWGNTIFWPTQKTLARAELVLQGGKKLELIQADVGMQVRLLSPEAGKLKVEVMPLIKHQAMGGEGEQTTNPLLEKMRGRVYAELRLEELKQVVELGENDFLLIGPHELSSKTTLGSLLFWEPETGQTRTLVIRGANVEVRGKDDVKGLKPIAWQVPK